MCVCVRGGSVGWGAVGRRAARRPPAAGREAGADESRPRSPCWRLGGGGRPGGRAPVSPAGGGGGETGGWGGGRGVCAGLGVVKTCPPSARYSRGSVRSYGLYTRFWPELTVLVNKINADRHSLKILFFFFLKSCRHHTSRWNPLKPSRW